MRSTPIKGPSPAVAKIRSTAAHKMLRSQTQPMEFDTMSPLNASAPKSTISGLRCVAAALASQLPRPHRATSEGSVGR